MGRAEAAEMVADVGRMQRATRRARRAIWFPLVQFGLIVLGAAPFYRPWPSSGSGLTIRNVGPVAGYLGGDFIGNAPAWYWLIALPLGYVATAAFLRWHAGRTGVAGRIAPYVAAGLGLFAFLVISSPSILDALGLPTSIGKFLWSNDLAIRGLTPLIAVALGFLVLAWVERSPALAAFSAAFLGLVLLANLYDIGNYFRWAGLSAEDPQSGAIVAGVALLLGGLGFGIAALRDR
jgi:hypothetical protein